jgi:hypothetical protein
MTNTPATLDVVTPDQLERVTGAGIGSEIGKMFGAEGAKWGGIADQFIGMIGQFTQRQGGTGSSGG